MCSLWTNLLLLHGHIHDPELVRRLVNAPSTSTPPPGRPGGTRQRMRSPLAAVASLYARRKQMSDPSFELGWRVCGDCFAPSLVCK